MTHNPPITKITCLGAGYVGGPRCLKVKGQSKGGREAMALSYTNVSIGVDFRSRLRGSGVSPDMERYTPAGETPALHFRSLKGTSFWYKWER
jgi:hypothetical protein